MMPNLPSPNRDVGQNLVCGKQAYTRSQDTAFWKFANVSNPSEAAEFINKACGAKSLRDIDASPEAVAKWQELDNQFRNANGSHT